MEMGGDLEREPAVYLVNGEVPLPIWIEVSRLKGRSYLLMDGSLFTSGCDSHA
jgi:hypothetical protein